MCAVALCTGLKRWVNCSSEGWGVVFDFVDCICVWGFGVG